MEIKKNTLSLVLVFLLLGVNMAYIIYMNVAERPVEIIRAGNSEDDPGNASTDSTVGFTENYFFQELMGTNDKPDATTGKNVTTEPEKPAGQVPNTPAESNNKAPETSDEKSNDGASPNTEAVDNGPELTNEPKADDTSAVPPPQEPEESEVEKVEEEEKPAEGAEPEGDHDEPRQNYEFDFEGEPYYPSHRVSLARTKVSLVIDNSYAVTDIQLGVANPTANISMKSFTIRIPEGAMVSNLTMELNGNTYYSFIIPKETEKVVKTGPDKMAVFIKWHNSNSLEMSLRVPPLSYMNVNLRHETFLKRYLGEFSYNVPLAGINSQEIMGEVLIIMDLYHQSGLKNFSVSGAINNNDLTITSNQAAGMVLARNQTSLQDIKLCYTVYEPPLEGDVTVHNDGDGGYFLLRFSPSANALQEAPVPKHIIFVIDRSGSMSGNKINQVKEAFEYVVNDLPADDKFNILTFSTGVEQYKPEIISASRENKQQAVNFINNIGASGSTNFNQAALDGLELLGNQGDSHIPIVVLLTDGQPTAGETDSTRLRNNIVNANTAHSSVFCLGFGSDVDFDFLRAISMENFGQAIKISTSGDPTNQITDFYRTISTPLLMQMNFGFSENVYDVSMESADYLFAGTDIAITGRFERCDSFEMEINATGRNGVRTFTDTVTVGENDNNPFVARLWAYQEIEKIMEQMEVYGETPELVDRVVELSCQYDFITEYTCFVVEIDDLNVWYPEDLEGQQEEPEFPPEEEEDDNGSNRSRSSLPFEDSPPDNDEPIHHFERDVIYRWTEEKKAVFEPRNR
ncbi:MAG: VWA domain-containing protein [Candidatus Thermoplasmatota archaeon]|nr:VWA domain-containing protein [Candidatus Thermoplasmatota archaeon]